MDQENINKFLCEVGISNNFTLKMIDGGMNNQVFQITHKGKDFLLKHYFSHPLDKRNRCNVEYDFLTFASQNNISNEN